MRPAGNCLGARSAGSLSDGSVQCNICGGSNTPPTQAPTPAPTQSTGGTDEQWLQGHNSCRTEFYKEHNKGSLDLKWTDSLKESSQNYANKLIQIGGSKGCKIQHGYDGDVYGGENIAATIGAARTPEEIMTAWYYNEIELPYGQKGHATQIKENLVYANQTPIWSAPRVMEDHTNHGKTA
jgi:hypothetical protein